ncbi:MAG TPA: response regulator [Dongiaceae bacterium]|nr:response regulator [Dongiaceae bacterium]
MSGFDPLVSIVDDDAHARAALLGLVRSFDFAVAGFSGAEEFLRSDAVERSRCLIADMRMPGITGLELYSRMVDRGTMIPTILITAFPDPDLRRRALRIGIADVVAKPPDPEALRRSILRALERR